MALTVEAMKFGNGVLKSVTGDLKSDGKMVINKKYYANISLRYS